MSTFPNPWAFHMFRAWLTGFTERLVSSNGNRSWQPSFELNLAYDRGATVADALVFWRSWRQVGQESAPSRFKWWLRARARQRESLKRSLARRKFNAWNPAPRAINAAGQMTTFGRG
jgi:hypothetical protein